MDKFRTADHLPVIHKAARIHLSFFFFLFLWMDEKLLKADQSVLVCRRQPAHHAGSDVWWAGSPYCLCSASAPTDSTRQPMCQSLTPDQSGFLQHSDTFSPSCMYLLHLPRCHLDTHPASSFLPPFLSPSLPPSLSFLIYKYSLISRAWLREASTPASLRPAEPWFMGGSGWR